MMKAVIFDLDGVICFTDHLHYQAWKKMADNENIYFDEVINNRLRGVSRMASLDIILENAKKTYTEEEKIALAKTKNDIYVKLLDSMSGKDLNPNTLKALKTLKEKGVKIAIGSSSKNAKLILTKLGIIDLFDKIADGTDITKSKPDPEVFLCAAKKLGVEPSEAYVVEDAISGIKAGHDGGFKTIAIGDAHKSSLVDLKINNLLEIVELF